MHCLDPDSLTNRWSLTTLPGDTQATFSPGGLILQGDEPLVEKHLAHVVDHDDGRREILSHRAFLAFVSSARSRVAADTPDPRHVEDTNR